MGKVPPGSDPGDDWVSVVQSSQPSASSLVVSDYSKDGVVTNPVEGNDVAGRKDFSNIPVNQYAVFNLNATGKSWISKTGVTKLGLREGHDIKNVAFAGTVGKFNQLQLRSSEYTGTSNDPVLEVTYTLPAVTPPPTVITYAYDPQGQRIILANGAKTTYYPTKLYNTDRTTITKHLFANGSDIATIEGSGATAKVYYNHADLLNSSSVMTDSVGVIAETLDYFPFGGIRIDDKTSVFSEQRKYIGQEYDTDTGLNYLNARYYDGKLGRFISEDPMFWNFDKAWLSDPQNQNSYAYARNNPIGLSDPSGLIVVTMSGTTFGLQKSDYLKDAAVLQTNVHNEFKGQDVLNFSWSGQDNDKARQNAAKDFSSYINNTMKNYSASEPLNIVCHSHGCNVVALYTQQQNVHQINNLISFEQPVLNEYTNNESKIDNHINVYSNKDQIQNHGGTEYTLTGLIGATFFGSRGGQIGDAIGWGEFGSAGRTIDGVNNIDVSGQTRWWRPIAAHSTPYGNLDVWAKINKSIK